MSAATVLEPRTKARGSLEIQGADGLIEIPPSEWNQTTKERCRRLMKSGLSEEARQLHAVQESKSMWWTREVCLMGGPASRPMTMKDQAELSGLHPRIVRKAQQELEAAGLSMRRSTDDSAPRKGHMEILSWAVPRKIDADKLRMRAAAISKPDPGWVPQDSAELMRFARRLRRNLPQELPLWNADARSRNFEAWQRAQLKLKEAEEEAARVLDTFCAQGEPEPHIEITEITRERTKTASPEVLNHHHQSSEEEERVKPSFQEGDDDENQKPKPEYATGRDELKAIYKAKAKEWPAVDLLDRIELTLIGRGKTWDDLVHELKAGGHLANTWRNPPGFLTDFARKLNRPISPPPQEKPKPKCPKCGSDSRRGAVLENGSIVPCPDCSTPEWVEEFRLKPMRAAPEV